MQNLPSNFISGVIIGVLASAFGFILTMLWDTYKNHQDKNNKNKAITTALRHEIICNISIFRHNNVLLQQELAILGNQEVVVDPLTPPHNQMWSAVILNMPDKFVRNQELLESLRETSQSVLMVTEIIKSRENYRINNTINTGRWERLKLYDGIILEHSKSVLKALEALVQEL